MRPPGGPRLRAAPSDPGAQPGPRGSSPWPLRPAAARSQDELSVRFGPAGRAPPEKRGSLHRHVHNAGGGFLPKEHPARQRGGKGPLPPTRCPTGARRRLVSSPRAADRGYVVFFRPTGAPPRDALAVGAAQRALRVARRAAARRRRRVRRVLYPALRLELESEQRRARNPSALCTRPGAVPGQRSTSPRTRARATCSSRRCGCTTGTAARSRSARRRARSGATALTRRRPRWRRTTTATAASASTPSGCAAPITPSSRSRSRRRAP